MKRNTSLPTPRRWPKAAAQLTALGAVVLAWPAHAAITQMTLGMGSSGSAPFDTTAGAGNDTGAGDNVVRTHDTVMYRTNYSLSAPDTNVLIHLELGPTTVPASYTGPANPQIAYFSVADLPSGPQGCANIQTTPVANPPPPGQSGVTADGKHLFCYQAGPTSASSLLFPYRVSGDAPNGATIGPLKYTLQSANNPAQSTPTVLNNPTHPSQPTYGNGTLNVSAAPRWKVSKFGANSPTGSTPATFVPGSGPGGEDGYVFPFHVGVYSEGSRKGLEALRPDFSIAETYANPDQPNIRLVTWDMVNTFANAPMGSGPGKHDGCGNWSGAITRLGAAFDNPYYHPNDGGPSTALGAVANGGDCKATAVNDAAKTATLSFTGVDSSLKHYPIQRGSNAGSALVNTTNLEDPSNQWWVASKLVLFWAPITDFTVGVNETMTNKVTLDARSVTGQTPPPSEATRTSSARRGAEGTSSKVYVPISSTFRIGAYNGRDYAPRDPNVGGDDNVNQVGVGQLFASRVIANNRGTETSTGGYVCDRIDNARTTFAGVANVGQPPSSARYRIDQATGVAMLWGVGEIPHKIQLGVGGAGVTNGTWDSFGTVNTEYGSSLAAGVNGDQATRGCGDTDATWYDSIAALQAAGKTLKDVSRVRMTFPSGFGPGVGVQMYIPLTANGTYSFTANDLANTAQGLPAVTHAAGSSTLGHIVPNQSTWVHNFPGIAPYNRSDALRIAQNQIIGIVKSEVNASLASGRSVPRGSLLDYKLVVNATSGTNAGQTTDVTVWDVLPEHMSYVPGSSAQGGTTIADPVCEAPGVTPGAPAPFAANSVPAGYRACRWVLTNQPVAYVLPGDAAGNLPALTYKARVAFNAPVGANLVNSVFADSTGNVRNKAEYKGGTSPGFACNGSDRCSFSKWAVTVDGQVNVLLDKEVSAATTTPNGGFSYKLRYISVGANQNQFRVLDVLPYNSDGRGTTTTGTLKLSSAIAAPAANASAVPPLEADSAMEVLYTKNAPASINRADPYHASHNLTGTVANSATVTNWCTVAQFGTANCPANVGEATAFMALPFGRTGVLQRDKMFELVVPVTTAGNTVGNHTYVNNFVADAPSLLARRPGSNPVTTTVTGAAPVTVSGRVYDETGNNTTDNGHATDPGLNGVSLSLRCTGPDFGPVTATTNATGNYSFANVPAGASCTLTETQPTGYTNAYKSSDGTVTTETGNANSVSTFTVPATGSVQNFAEVSRSTVTGRVYTETGNNTTDDGNTTDPGVGGVSLSLSCTSPNFGPATTTTAADGTYSFANVPVGASCTLTETQPANFLNAYKSGNGTVTSESGAGNSSSTFTMTSAPSVQNFAELATKPLTGRVYVETGSNTIDNGHGTDPGLPGVNLSLVCTNPDFGAVNATTDATGNYSFPTVPVGANCTLTQTQPVGYHSVYNSRGGTVTSESGTANSVVTFTMPNAAVVQTFAEISSSAVPGAPVAVPTLGWPMLGAMSALLAALGGRRRQRKAA